MAVVQPTTDDYVLLCGVPWETYKRMLDALGEHHWRHVYVQGTLEMPSLVHGLTWQEYRKFLDALGDLNLRHTFSQGTLEMMSPRKDHDWYSRLIGRLIQQLALDLNIEIQSIGSTTLLGEHAERSVQPDEAYYVANEAVVRGKKQFDPQRDPPPDLIVEVDVTNSCLPRLPIFASLRIPELWRFDGKRMRFHGLEPTGEYQELSHGRAFPMVVPADFDEALGQSALVTENELVRSFVRRVRARLNEQGSA